ncbi:S8 family peptidase [Candidatus Clostridium stratigraminis]|uniref:S8 family peptidase n=1 Tax=Candidatus Clostridium stratigraminis TaxID=3381661 RepID=A0ABW8T437_9CLOT
MNNILQLKGQFQQRKNSNLFGPTNLPKGAIVTAQHIEELKEQLQRILVYWEKNQTIIGGALVSVHYRHVVAKSNRLKTLLGEGSKSPKLSIRGAKFVWGPEMEKGGLRQKHVFTHFINLKAIQDSIEKLDASVRIVREKYKGKIKDKDTEQINKGNYSDSYISKSTFLNVIVDAHFVEQFDIDRDTKKIEEESIITIYKTGVETSELLRQFGIDMINAKMIDETTLRLDPDEIRMLQENAPYLIAMNVIDLSEIAREDILDFDEDENNRIITIPRPNQEPVVGVIDTQFDNRVYFHEWVKYEKKLSSDIEIEEEDYKHGTAVSSIIVDGPAFNPGLDDGCGRFRVRHFGVAKAGKFSSFTILKLIRNIVAVNRDIKVWNLSLGSAMQINNNFISPEAAELDKIQSEYDVIFVVAGTNKGKRIQAPYKIGAPADSLNSLVVNAVDFTGKSASYTRIGPVLSFFHKPDVSYYGGDGPEKIVVFEPLGKAYVTGTSFAAPWITRKMAYLIHIMGLSREVAKALLIDSAAGWKRKDDGSFRIGYGIVPKRIEDILHSKDDEIRFIMTGSIDEYETYTYNIPVPQDMNAHPYFAKATLVYFPKSDRNQGVDYTSTEMDIHFGRIMDKAGKAVIKTIDCNNQAEDGVITIYEEEARKMYRKWDNVKHINETIKAGARPRKVYDSGMWGLSIKTKERLEPKAGRGLQFGVIVTLKEMNGVNRIDDFIKMCMVRGWIVNRLDIDNQFDVYHKAEEEIDFE